MIQNPNNHIDNNQYTSILDMFVADHNTSNPKLVAEDEKNRKTNSNNKRKVRHDYHDHANDAPASSVNKSAPAATVVCNNTTMMPVAIPSINFHQQHQLQHTVQHQQQQQHQEQQQQQQQHHEMEEAEDDANKKRRGPRGGVAVPFPEKLHLMLSSVERDGNSHIVSWQMHGRCFVVHKPKEFVSLVMPTYFRQTKLTSFQRQLNLYGFCRLTSGRDRGGYYHELFLRGKPFLCKRMMRTRIKGTGIKAASSPHTEPDFYSMPPVKDFSQSSSSLEEYMQPKPITSMHQQHHQQQQQPVMTQQQHQVALVTPPAVMVTPIHMPTVAPPELSIDMILLSESSNSNCPQPDSLIKFEGQQFHYLDPSSLGVSSDSHMLKTSYDAGEYYPLNDIVMV